eukprot:NODE_9588_length_1413_cov_2.211509.p1 GENE.NODE_9588_length_1413_cov_2.211509~~NODE_9588_length_1413_cov_2.211509.p1  ORF type:complete len:439 (+),score=124.88 NODE_9588_length_1413_cov_2.211509:53-1369(+)
MRAPFAPEALLGTVLQEGTVVGHSDLRGAGVGLRATRPFEVGGIVYRECLLAFVQNGFSAAAAPACVHCSRVIGGGKRGLRAVLERALAASEGVEVALVPGLHLADYPHLEATGFLDDERFRTPTPATCTAPGCRALFCSKTCRDEALSRGHHRILCAELPKECRPLWGDFVGHARIHCESFLLAAHVVAQVACDALHGGGAGERAPAHYAGFFSRSWHELLQDDLSDRAAWVETRWATLEASRAMLTRLLAGRLPPGADHLVSSDGYAQLVGMLDLVARDVGCANPIDGPLRPLLQGMPVRAVTDMRKIGLRWLRAKGVFEDAQEPMAPEESEDDEDEGAAPTAKPSGQSVGELAIVPGFRGLALTATAALTNHSCAPNVKVGRVEPGHLEAVALRAIGEDEEILMSYIDEHEPAVSLRRELLRSYGFLCHCPRCEV